MAYTNGVFYIHLQNGSDTARTALTTCVASNPSGTVTRINKTAHGLVTGAIVDLTLFSAWLNDAWKITKVDNDNFDLDGAVWQTTADNNGTATPRGGSSWSDAWKTIGTGATAARIQPGDEIRINKTPNPVSIGNATWTNLSKTVTFATASCLTIDNCETAWTATGSTVVTVGSTNPFAREGTNALRISRSVYTTSSLIAYRNFTSSIDLTQFNGLTFWYGAGIAGSAITANTFKLTLCTGSNGSGIVNEFIIPANVVNNRWNCTSLTNSLGTGSVLSSNINSIALYTIASPTGGTQIIFDNISAFKTGSLSLTTLISKNSSSFGGEEPWLAIQSINNNTILLDNSVTAYSYEGQGYYGNTETVNTYIRESFVTTPVSSVTTNINTVQDSGIFGSLISYKGGWNTGSNVQDGETYCMAANGIGYFLGMSSKNYISIERLCPSRYTAGFYNDNCQFLNINCSNINNNETAYYDYLSLPLKNSSIISKNMCNNGEAFNLTLIKSYFSCSNINSNASNSVLESVDIEADRNSSFYAQNICNNLTSGITIRGIEAVFNIKNVNQNGLTASTAYGIDSLTPHQCTIIGTIMSGNKTAAMAAPYQGNLNLINCTLYGTEFSTFSDYYDSYVRSQNHDLSGQDWTFTDGGTINSQSSSFSASTGKEWRLLISKNTRNENYPLKLEIGKFVVNSGSLVTVSSKMKKSHATDINGKLVIFTDPPDRSNKIVSTLQNNTNEQTISGSFIPTSNGVIGVEVWAEYVSAVGSVTIDNINVTQS